MSSSLDAVVSRLEIVAAKLEATQVNIRESAPKVLSSAFDDMESTIWHS